MGDKYKLLERHFGYTSFREGQEEIIDALLSGQDAVGIMPTGAGKSICFQLPALLLEGVALIISPLISLMKDQVSALAQAGVRAAFINSTLSPLQVRKALGNARQGVYKIIYVAPERLETGEFLEFARNTHIPFVAVDEAHCVSQWGQDFRPSYLRIQSFLEALPRRPIVGAFTATATGQVRQDIVDLLQLRKPLLVSTGFDRANLYFEVQSPKNKFDALRDFLRDRPGRSGIIYCLTRKTVEQLHEKLLGFGWGAARYHAGLDPEERRENQERFQNDEVQIMVATNAFGMGIDKSNVSFVVHYNMPKNLEAYYQEAGRAGRDGSPAECLLLYSGQDVVTNQYFIDNGENGEMDPRLYQIFQKRERDRLRLMTFYCHSTDCLRAYVLDYFGEKAPAYCGNCFNCLHHYEKRDITLEAQKILSCVKRMGERFGAKMTMDVLRGISNEKVERQGFQKLPTFGLLADTGEKQIREMINYLVFEGYLLSTEDAYPVLRLGKRAGEVLFYGKTLEMNILKEETAQAPKGAAGVENPRLYAKLQALRSKLAQAQSVPAYVVFTDSALREMCRILPKTTAELLRVNGVGQVKLERYGEAFLEVIREFELERQPDGPGEAQPAGTGPKSKPRKQNALEEQEQPVEILSRMYRDKLITKGFGQAFTEWTEEEDSLLRERWQTEQDLEQLAKVLEKHPGAVSTRLKQMGIT